jgi:hypothetical protein
MLPSNRHCATLVRPSEGVHTGTVLVYKPHFLDLIAQRCRRDINEARRRVYITGDGKYRYYPSRDYLEYKKQFKIRY